MTVSIDEVEFPDGGHAVVVRARSGEPAESLLAAAQVRVEGPRPVLVVCGGADDLQGRAGGATRSAEG